MKEKFEEVPVFEKEIYTGDPHTNKTYTDMHKNPPPLLSLSLCSLECHAIYYFLKECSKQYEWSGQYEFFMCLRGCVPQSSLLGLIKFSLSFSIFFFSQMQPLLYHSLLL